MVVPAGWARERKRFSRCGGAARCPVAAARVSASADWPLARAARPCRGALNVHP